jgi:hypothetical protein
MREDTMTDITRVEFEVLHGLRVRGIAGPAAVAEMLTIEGRSRHDELRQKLTTTQETEALQAAYESFLGPNRAFKKLTTDWQNDTSRDLVRILPRLNNIHVDISAILSRVAASVPRMTHYQPRLNSALTAFSDGNTEALARPMTGSYHDVWMELHEDLLLALARQRTDEDE